MEGTSRGGRKMCDGWPLIPIDGRINIKLDGPHGVAFKGEGQANSQLSRGRGPEGHSWLKKCDAAELTEVDFLRRNLLESLSEKTQVGASLLSRAEGLW